MLDQKYSPLPIPEISEMQNLNFTCTDSYLYSIHIVIKIMYTSFACSRYYK